MAWQEQENTNLFPHFSNTHLESSSTRRLQLVGGKLASKLGMMGKWKKEQAHWESQGDLGNPPPFFKCARSTVSFSKCYLAGKDGSHYLHLSIPNAGPRSLATRFRSNILKTWRATMCEFPLCITSPQMSLSLLSLPSGPRPGDTCQGVNFTDAVSVGCL